MKFFEFFEHLQRLGLEKFRRYYGPYRARVTDNNDPEFRGRVQLECPRAYLKAGNGNWVLPMESGGANSGRFWPPEAGSMVWVFFDNGDPTVPLCYMGGWYSIDKVDADIRPEDGGPDKRGWVTPGGHKIILSDKDGEEEILVSHSKGKIVKITEDKISIGNVDGDFEPMMRGSTVKKWLENHTHGHSFGPTSIPLQPFPLDGLSDDTETS